MSRPRRTGTQHLLPFSELSGASFERLCLWLLREEGYTSLQHLGAAGADDGCDILAMKNDQRWFFQCKKMTSGSFGAGAVEREINKIRSWPIHDWPNKILFMVTANVSATTRRRANERSAPISCEFWAITELDERVKRHPRIVTEFFNAGPSDHALQREGYGFDTSLYVDAIDRLFERERVAELWVSLLGHVQDNGIRRSVDVEQYIDQWLHKTDGPHLSILGDYGTGKTWLCLRLARRLIDEHRKNPARPLPLLLSFRSYRSGMQLRDLIQSEMDRAYGLAQCDFRSILSAIIGRRLVVILDGLDEMARELGRRGAFVQFAALAIPADAKVLLTSRTHYFLSGSEQREVLNPEAATLLREIPSFDLVHLDLFDESRMRDAISRSAMEDHTGSVFSFVESTYNLQELCARPVLLRLVCESFASLKNLGSAVTSADLYEAYLTAWLRREVAGGRMTFNPEDLLIFLEELAEALFPRDSMWISADGFERRVRDFRSRIGLSQDDERTLMRQLATSTVLTRSVSDGWEFSHRSFQEYLYARRFFRWEAETNGSTHFPVTHIPAWQFISQIVLRQWNESKAREWIEQRIGRESDPGLCKTTLRAAAAYWLLNRSPRAAGEYPLSGIMLDWVELAGVNLSKADLSGADFQGSNLHGANLREANLEGACLVAADFSGANLVGANFKNADCRRTIFDGAIGADEALVGAIRNFDTLGSTPILDAYRILSALRPSKKG
jgi:hypothetical protein